MYRKRNKKQLSLIDDFLLPFDGKLNSDNRWVKLAKIMPWDAIEEKYAAKFAEVGAPAKPVRMALGSLIIKERLGLSDQETVQHIVEGPYLQFFIGLDRFVFEAPFDSSMMVHFRKRFDLETMKEINELVCKEEQDTEKPDDFDPPSPRDGDGAYQVSSEDGAGEKPESPNSGNLLIDATCAPADIHFPTDTWLLNEAREKLEDIIDVLHEPLVGQEKKPRNYRENARRDYLRFTKKRKHSKKAIRKAIGKQLRYIKRDLVIIKALKEKTSLMTLTKQQYKDLLVINELYRQQLSMYQTRSNRVDDRIVSIHQPHIRPIVRGKASAKVEFGAKITASIKDGYSFIEEVSFDNYNESETLKESVYRFKARFGCFPEAIMADKIFRNRENLRFCKENNIRISGPRLGRPTACEINEGRDHERKDAGIRNAIEGKFGEAKRKYGLGRIMARLKETSECVIALQFLVMNLEHKLRLFLYFFKCLLELEKIRLKNSQRLCWE